MYNPNMLASLTLSAARPRRSFTALQRDTLVRLLPSLTGTVWALVTLALRYYSVEVN